MVANYIEGIGNTLAPKEFGVNYYRHMLDPPEATVIVSL
ncbi:hypothetical protein LLB_3540 [Legionella longbeachae D-4968]|nr:hypothetical protein LLB_3540 [Legionella longbeachae D-4968]